MKLRTLVIDDEPIALEKLRKYVEKVPFLELAGACRSGLEATAFISSENVDLVFSDINMPDMNGLEFIGSLTKVPLVVFTTAYADYAVDSYRFSAVDYLLKPYGFAEFQRAANKALERYNLAYVKNDNADSSGSLFIKVDYRYVRVKLANIRYIKGYGEYLQIFTVNDSSPLLTLSSFSAIEEKLSSNFLKVHRSYIVNMDLVESVNKGRISMDIDTMIPVGDSYRNVLIDYLSSRTVGMQRNK